MRGNGGGSALKTKPKISYWPLQTGADNPDYGGNSGKGGERVTKKSGVEKGPSPNRPLEPSEHPNLKDFYRTEGGEEQLEGGEELKVIHWGALRFPYY